MSALPIFPGSLPPSIVGANELNFCVRYGNRWILIAINTVYTIDTRSWQTFLRGLRPHDFTFVKPERFAYTHLKTNVF